MPMFGPNGRKSKRRRRSSCARNSSMLKFEKLEPRNLLAGVFLFPATGELTIFGDGEDNIARVDEVNGQTIRTTLDGLGSQDFDREDVQTIFFIGFGGNDNYLNNTSLPSMMYGHAGDDILQGGSSKNTIVGGAGNDQLRGGDLDDYLMGGNGDDLLVGNAGNDRIVAGDGTNRVYGGDGSDLIFGGNQVDTIYAGAGSDQVFALDGDDLLYSGPGGVAGTGGIDQADLILGLGGNDIITGASGLDVFYGGDGDDILVGGVGENRLHGQNGNDQLTGGPLLDYLNGGNGNDTIRGFDGADGIFGSNGDDTIFAGAGNDFIIAGAGSDVVTGGAGNDTIDAGISLEDVAVFSSAFADYSLSPSDNGQRVIVTGPDGIDTVLSNERFRFDDTEVDSNGDEANQSVISIRASGDMGTERFELQIKGQTVATFNVGNSFALFDFQADSQVLANDVRIVFDNDEYDPGNGIDANLNVDWIEIDGERFETESPLVFSTGTWTAEDGIQPGFGRGDTLHTNGYFQFANGSTITVRASGDQGTEQFELQIVGQESAVYSVGTSMNSYAFRAKGKVTLDQIRIVYFDDLENKNLNIDWVAVDGVRHQTEAASVYSNGTWTAVDGVLPGFGRGETLNVNGFFQYSAINLRDDVFSLPEDSVNVPTAVLANDQNSLGVDIVIESFSQPANGVLQFSDQEFRYTPNSNFTGSDQFSYWASIDGFERGPITVSLTVNRSHEQPQSAINPAVSVDLAPSGVFLEVEKLVQIPRGQNNRQPRLNGMATIGERIFVMADGGVDNEGPIYEIKTVNGVTQAELFFDVGAAVIANTGRRLDNSSPQGGFRSVAFHPEFETNGKFFTTFMEGRPADPAQHFYLSDSTTPVDVDSVLAEWSIDLATGKVDPGSYREIFRVGMPVYEHPIQWITFNEYSQPGDEDYGLLYIGHGDGSVLSAVAGDGQNNDALGKILRVNPLQNGANRYTVPNTNPFVGDTNMLDEVFALGFRNPHNMSFALDASGNHHLIVAEIGRDNIEEINIVAAGGNYGWADREGPFVHERDEVSGVNLGISNLPADEAEKGYTYPVSILGHNGEIGDSFIGQAIAGGHVIQNGSSPLNDQYIFVEFSTDGRAYHIDFSDMLEQTTLLDPNDPNKDAPSDLSWLDPQELTVLFDHDNDDSTTPLVRDSLKDVLDDEPDFNAFFSEGKTRADLRLGKGPNGELYILNKRNGWVYLATDTVAPGN